MRNRILQISHVENSRFEKANFEEFVEWITKQVRYQLDIETPVCEKWNEYRLITIQFGSCTSDRRQYVFQWSELTEDQQGTIKEILENDTQEKLGHNIVFEYVVLRNHGITIGHLYDTMIAEKILHGGMENIDYALADISWKYLRIIMDKSQQKLFGDNIMNDEKLEYACTDVTYLDIIQKQQIEKATKEELSNIFALEMEVITAFGDISFEGMYLDQEKWRENIKLAMPLVKAAHEALNAEILKQPFYEYSILQGFVSSEDRITINFNSVHQRMELLQLLFPNIVGGTKAIVKSYIRDNGKTMPFADMNLLQCYMEKNYSIMEGRLIDQHKQYLIDKQYLIPAGEITINWGSPVQVLGLLQQQFPRLKSTGEEAIGELNHPIAKQLLKYRESLKLVNDLGEDYITKYVCSDGKVRTTFDTIKSTGRVGSKRPNMQNIIVKEFVGTRYRNAFTPEPGWVYVSGDYVSQELVEIAYISKEPAWLEAIAKGQDLHSVSAEIVYGTKWKDAQSDGCEFYKMTVTSNGTLEMAKQKCSCKKHKTMRGDVKSINFLLAYGGTEYKLSGELGISLKEAKALIQLYFSKLPRIEAMFKFLGEFTLLNGYTMTLAPFNRKRWFPFWRENRTYVEAHISGIKYNPSLGEMQKAGMNHPIQGTAADITKVAMVLVRNYIRENKLQDKVKIVCQVHDQIDTICLEEMAQEWKLKLQELMEQAACVVIPSGILKSEVNISPFWTK